MREEVFAGVGGLKIFLRSWRPEGAPRGVVVLVHGFKAHGGLFGSTAAELAEHGFACYALDLRGHGKSEGERYHVGTAAEFVDDVARLVALAKSRDPELPVFLLGHSAGGVISTLYALDHQHELTGFICESFAYEVAPPAALALIKGISRPAPNLPVLDLKDADFSRDPTFVAAMKSDPLIPHLRYPAHTVAEMARGNDRLKREFPGIILPLLIIHGTADKVTRPSGSKHFYEAAGAADKTLQLYSGHFHDLLNDLGREQVLGDIINWMENRLPSRFPLRPIAPESEIVMPVS